MKKLLDQLKKIQQFLFQMFLQEKQNHMFYVGFICSNQNLETTQMSMKRWVNKLWYIYTKKHYTEIKKKLIIMLYNELILKYVERRKTI